MANIERLFKVTIGLIIESLKRALRVRKEIAVLFLLRDMIIFEL